MEPIQPDLFHIDYNILLETLITIVVFSFIIERALSVIFESRPFINWAEASPEGASDKKTRKTKKKGVRELIAVITSVIFVLWIQFDAISIILQSSQEATVVGMIFTAFLIAGGSKASTGIFKDLLNFMSSAEKERRAAQENQ